MITVNRLCRDLGIKHPLDHPTCIGYGKAKPTCGILCAQASRNEAVTALEGICEAIADGINPRMLVNDLEGVAQLLHCKRWHQYQARAKAREWRRKLDEAMAQRNEEQHQRQHQRQSRSRREFHRPGNNNQIAPPADSHLASFRDEDILAELAHRLQSQSHVISSIRAILDNQRGRNQRSPGRSSSDRTTLSSFSNSLESDDEFSEASDSETEDGDDNEDSDLENSDTDTSYSRSSSGSSTSRSNSGPIQPTPSSERRSRGREHLRNRLSPLLRAIPLPLPPLKTKPKANAASVYHAS
ncbi:uncharacterized protein Z518_03031 [Rhinocladiella mackenziei CBS 650.93]|uniref:Uncharacterized protein n=1 Tax=Rhinocladiella mackenziei CBS 650.93 TaxID=1442369 RepID=A0A0D2JGB2_9EURO|nr:uncharacterized protein Z518_03031 [Rhinocladiella mackenziei CBS 650.93]KIX08375.1 hypothetical protein Z518_03031 [Rhinocladiella mackenziei CBS 650.93]